MIMLSLLFLCYSVNAQTKSVYPCIWEDTTTNARLDLQLFKNVTLNTSDANISIYYTPCANGLIMKSNNKATMVYIEDKTNNNEQNLGEWNNGIITPNHEYNKWNFQYYYNKSKCDGASESKINITWQCVGGTVLNPYIFNVEYNINNLCNIEMIIFSAVACLTGTSSDCTFYDNNNDYNKLDLSMFGDEVIKTEINYPHNYPNSFYYSPCIPSQICNNYMVLASEINTLTTDCNHSLALYTPYMNSNIYGNIGYDIINQVWSLQYYSGDKCDNDNINRLFDISWQCDTSIYPMLYLIGNDSSELTECVDELTVISSYACLDFIPCIYNQTNAVLNLTNIFPVLFETEYDNMNGLYLFYSPCQLGLNNKSQSTDIGSLYNIGNAIIGEYIIKSDNNSNSKYIGNGIYSVDYTTQPIYNKDDKSWQFVYNDPLLSYKFVVTWECKEGADIDLYAIKSPDLSQLIVYTKEIC